MNGKRHVVRGLLRLYPAEWRAQYMEELAGLLSRRPITASVLADVTQSAVRERLRRDEPWKACGALLFAWTLLTMAIGPSRSGFELGPVWAVILLLAGYLTAVQKRGASPSRMAAKAALVGFLPVLTVLTLWATGVLHPLAGNPAGIHPAWAVFAMSFTPSFQPDLDIPLCAPGIVAVIGGIHGFLGGLLGKATLFLSAQRGQQ